MEEISKPFKQDVGLHNLELFYSLNDDWLVAVNDKQEVLGLLLQNIVKDGIHFNWHATVRQDMIRTGLTKLFTPLFEEDYRGVGNANGIAVQQFGFALDRFTEKILYCDGFVNPTRIPLPLQLPSDVTIQELTSCHLQALYDYDKPITGGFKSEYFMKQWSLPENAEHAKCFVAINGEGQLCGYGVLRKFTSYYAIMPCLADSAEIGQNLLVRIINFMVESKLIQAKLVIGILANNMTALKFFKDLGIEVAYPELTCYRIKEALFDKHFKGKIQHKKVFAIQEYFPI